MRNYKRIPVILVLGMIFILSLTACATSGPTLEVTAETQGDAVVVRWAANQNGILGSPSCEAGYGQVLTPVEDSGSTVIVAGENDYTISCSNNRGTTTKSVSVSDGEAVVSDDSPATSSVGGNGSFAMQAQVCEAQGNTWSVSADGRFSCENEISQGADPEATLTVQQMEELVPDTEEGTVMLESMVEAREQCDERGGEFGFDLEAGTTTCVIVETPVSAETPTPNPETDEEVSVAPDVSGARIGEWEIVYRNLDDDPIVAAWLDRLQDPAPALWPVFPNVENPEVPEFDVANGAEYGEDESPFGESGSTDWVVPAWHYRLISGDYEFSSSDFSYECRNDDPENRHGCLIVLFNVMEESFTWRGQMVDNGFTVMGRYWNGDALEWAAWGLVSHASANMLNLPTTRDPNTGNILNAGGASGNAGANCGVQPDACPSVDATIIVHAGDRILAVAHTVVER